MSALSERPWSSIPAEALDVLAPALPALVDEIIDAIATEVPAYALPLEGAFGEGVRRGVEQALEQFAEMAANSELGREAGREVYVALGRGEVRAGRRLDALLAAYRVGARVAWRRLAATGLEAGLAPEALVTLAESIFAYIDELSAESAEGYAREQAERAGERDRRRQELVALLLQAPAPEATALAAAAGVAQWRVPDELLVVVWNPDARRRPGSRLPVDSIVATVDRLACGVVPDPGGPGRAGETLRALEGTAAGVGPPVDPPGAGRSLRRATAALRLAETRGTEGPLVAAEHRTELLLRSDPTLVAELADECLAPLADETAVSRERLRSTLLAWLRSEGSVTAASEELHVHPQTVRYRLGRLRGLFGPALADPDARFTLELALRAQAVAGAEVGERSPRQAMAASPPQGSRVELGGQS
jgi:hypothetical protein